MGGGIHDQCASAVDGAHRLGAAGRSAAAPKEGANARAEDAEVDRLHEVVVRAGFEAVDDIEVCAAGREHKDGDEVAGTQQLEHSEAIELREHPVEDNEVEGGVGEGAYGFEAVERARHLVALARELLREQRVELGLIFDDEDAGAHRWGLWQVRAAAGIGDCHISAIPQRDARIAAAANIVAAGNVMIGILGRLAGLAVALVLLAIVFGIFERFWPAIRGHKLLTRKGFKTDVAWFAFTPIVGRVIVTVGVALALLPLLLAAHVTLDRESIQAFINRDTWLTAQPAWFQVVAILVAGDVLSYWLHRAFHVQPTLWKYHAVHHSSEDLDWLSAVRVHPFNEIGMRGAQAFGLIALGFSPVSVAAFVPVLTFYAIFLHANVSWAYGPLRYVVASPAFHRWHHTSEEEG